MNDYQAPAGRPYRDWRSVFDDAQTMRLAAFNTGFIAGALKNNTQPETFPPHRDAAERYEYAVMAFHFEPDTRRYPHRRRV